MGLCNSFTVTLQTFPLSSRNLLRARFLDIIQVLPSGPKVVTRKDSALKSNRLRDVPNLTSPIPLWHKNASKIWLPLPNLIPPIHVWRKNASKIWLQRKIYSWPWRTHVSNGNWIGQVFDAFLRQTGIGGVKFGNYFWPDGTPQVEGTRSSLNKCQK